MKIFGNTISAECSNANLQFVVEESDEIFRAARFDYLVFLNAQHDIVTVVQMNRELSHKLLRVEPRSDVGSDEGFRVGFVFQNQFKNLLTQPIAMQDGQTRASLSFNSIPFEAPKRVTSY